MRYVWFLQIQSHMYLYSCDNLYNFCTTVSSAKDDLLQFLEEVIIAAVQ